MSSFLNLFRFQHSTRLRGLNLIQLQFYKTWIPIKKWSGLDKLSYLTVGSGILKRRIKVKNGNNCAVIYIFTDPAPIIYWIEAEVQWKKNHHKLF